MKNLSNFAKTPSVERKSGTSGMTVLEVVVAAAIIVIAVLGIAGAWQLYLKVANVNAQQTQAALLVEEASEALNILRDQSWTANISSLVVGTTYYIYWNGSAYATTTTPTPVANSYTRTIVMKSVLRDANKDISSSGDYDLNTRQTTITIYPVGNPSNVLMQADMLIHNVYNN